VEVGVKVVLSARVARTPQVTIDTLVMPTTEQPVRLAKLARRPTQTVVCFQLPAEVSLEQTLLQAQEVQLLATAMLPSVASLAMAMSAETTQSLRTPT
jgi:hypothetical protein